MIKFFSCLILSQIVIGQATAQVLDRNAVEAKRLLERISGIKVPGDLPLLLQITEKLRAGDRVGAAELATTHPQFLNSTVKLMALKMSTREESLRLELNDFAAAFIGITRDQTDARELLTGNFSYMADATKLPTGVAVRSDMIKDVLQSNNHYRDLENPLVDIGQVLKRMPGQVLLDGQNMLVANPDPAGVLTSRAFMEAHTIDGTNRRAVEYTFREFMCVPIQNWADTKASDIRIGRDIDRFPGGDHNKFQTSCKGCHTQMDSLRGAFAKWDFDGGKANNGSLVNRPGGFNAQGIANKMNGNGNVFASGYVTKDDSFINNSIQPVNAAFFQWRGKSSGNGVKEFGTMVANSKRFSQCMVKRVYDAVCRTDLTIQKNMPFITSYAEKFEQNNYNLKQLFKEVAISPECSGQ